MERKALIGEQIIVTHMANNAIEIITRAKQNERKLTTKLRKYSPKARVVNWLKCYKLCDYRAKKKKIEASEQILEQTRASTYNNNRLKFNEKCPLTKERICLSPCEGIANAKTG